MKGKSGIGPCLPLMTVFWRVKSPPLTGFLKSRKLQYKKPLACAHTIHSLHYHIVYALLTSPNNTEHCPNSRSNPANTIFSKSGTTTTFLARPYWPELLFYHSTADS